MNVFDLAATLTLNKTDYERKLKDAESDTKGFATTTKTNLKSAAVDAGKSLAAIGAAAVAATAAMIKLAKSTAAYGDAVDKGSQKFGMSAKAYQEWDAILQHSGSSISSIQMGIRTLTTAMDALANGEVDAEKSTKSITSVIGRYGTYVGEAVKATNALAESQDEEKAESLKSAKALKTLGVAVKDASGKTRLAEDVFADVITALQNIEDPTKRSALANEVLGRSAMDLGALLNTTAEDTEKMRKRVHELGGVMSDEGVKASARFTDNIQDLKTATLGILRSGMEKALPAVNSAIEKVIDYLAGPEGQKAAESLGKIFTTFGNIFANMIPKVLSLLDDGGKKLAIFGTAIAGVALVIKAFTNPVGALVSSLTLLTGAIGIASMAMSTLTEDQLNNVEATLKQVAAFRSAERARNESFFAISEEERRTKKLWEELKNLADENGNVTEANRDRANFILGELRNALGIENQLIDGQISKYGELSESIDKIIAKRKAQAMIEANQQVYQEALGRTKDIGKDIEEKRRDIELAKARYDELVDYYGYNKETGKFEADKSKASVLEIMTVASKDIDDARKAVTLAENEYDALFDVERESYAIIDRMNSAMEAFEKGLYDVVKSELEFDKVVDKFQAKYDAGEVLSYKDFTDLFYARLYKREELNRYKEGLEAGYRGYTEEGYAEMKEALDKLDSLYTAAVKGETGKSGISGEGVRAGYVGAPVQVNLVVDGKTFGSVVFDAYGNEYKARGGAVVDV